MNRIVFLFMSVVFLTTACSTSQKTAEDSISEVDTLQHALLWEISGENLNAPSYLFGTIHMIEKESFFLPEGTLSSIESAEQIVFEIDMREMTDMGNTMGMLDRMFMQGDTTLGDLLNEEDYTLVRDHFREMGLPMMFLDRIKPMLLSFFAGSDVSPSDFQSGEIVSYEMKLLDMAEAQSKETAGLETMDFQLSIIDSIPYEAQAEMLMQSIEMMDAHQAEFDHMIRLYENQNINALNDLLMGDEGGIEPYSDLLVHRRNRNWVPKMEELMMEKTSFFAVGAGHLPGQYGVIELLREQGYTVQPFSKNDQ